MSMLAVDMQKLRAILELFYFGSGVVIAITAAFALRHLKLGEETLAATRQQLALATASLEQARADMQIRSRREAVTLGAQLCDRYADQVIPMINALCMVMKRNDIEFHRWTLRDGAFGAESIIENAMAKSCHDKLLGNEEAHDIALHLLNDLEALAIYFVKGAADESTAFASIGQPYCEIVEELAHCLVYTREIDAPAHCAGRYENMIELYTTWNDRIRHRDLQQQSAQVRSQIEAIQPRLIQPIGTTGGA